MCWQWWKAMCQVTLSSGLESSRLILTSRSLSNVLILRLLGAWPKKGASVGVSLWCPKVLKRYVLVTTSASFILLHSRFKSIQELHFSTYSNLEQSPQTSDAAQSHFSKPTPIPPPPLPFPQEPRRLACIHHVHHTPDDVQVKYGWKVLAYLWTLTVRNQDKPFWQW